MESGCNQIKKSTGRQVGKDHYLAATDIQESRIKHDLAKSMREEQLAADDYRGRGKYASDAGDNKTSQLYEHIAKEEGLHKQEFQERGQKLSGQYSTTVHAPLTQQPKYYTIAFKGDTVFKEGETVSEDALGRENDRVVRLGKRPARGWNMSRGKVESGGNGHSPEPDKLPATITQGEPIPDKYRELTPFIDEPLPPGTDFLLPAVVVQEGERKIDAVLRQLKDGVEGIQDSSQFRLFLTTMSKFHDYSIGNLILIAIQKPVATKVAGFQTWKDLGRWVMKGATGIAILAPIMPPKPKKEEREEEEEEVSLAPVNFKVVHVFDISQTKGKPLPEFDVPVLTGEANEELFAKALALAKAQGVEVNFESRPHQDPSIKGQYSPGSGIWVRPEEPRAQQLKSLLHELAHYYSEGVFRIPRRDAETIAESGAFAVGAHFGFDSGTRSFPYVALWSQDKKVLQANLASIRKVATVMLEGLEKNLMAEDKLIPALQPYEPHHFAEYVLRYNRFSDAEIPIYSGLAGKSPLRVSDHIWREVIAETEGDFVKQGEINVFHIPEKERPSYMYAPPFGGFGKAVIPESVSPDIADIITTKLSKLSEKYGLPADRSAERTKAQSDLLVRLTLKAETGAKEVNPAISDTIWDVYKYLYNLMNVDEIEQYKKGKKERPVGMLDTIPEVNWNAKSSLPKEVSDILLTEPVDMLFEKFNLPSGRGMPRTPDQSKRLVELGLKANWGAEQVALSHSHPAWKVVIALEDMMNDQEFADYTRRKKDYKMTAVILNKPSTPSPREELEFVSDSPELIPFTIEDIGYRDKLDNAFEAAIARAKGG